MSDSHGDSQKSDLQLIWKQNQTTGQHHTAVDNAILAWRSMHRCLQVSMAVEGNAFDDTRLMLKQERNRWR
jgi:inhibitor of KinA sporulation pathway (predicted exonuclease)